MRSSPEKRMGALKVARWATLLAWVCGLSSIGLTWVQSRWYVFHPHYLPLFLLFAGLAASTFVALACCLWRILRGPHRFHAAVLAVLTILPVGFWANVAIAAKRNWVEREVPNTFTMCVAKAMGVAFIRAEAEYRYRHRMETDRLLMVYDHLDYPEEDLAAMDRHVARLEELLDGTLGTKIYWVRGSLPCIGQGWLSVHGLCLGSESSPETLGLPDPGFVDYRGDRHELAHAVLEWFRTPQSDIPCMLNEGWAMAQCGDSSLELAQAAASLREESPSLGVREMLGTDWYYRSTPPVYSVGGAFVDFLIRTQGAARFRRFALEIRPDTVEEKCREILGTSLEDLEANYWKEVERALHGTEEGQTPENETE